MAPAFDWGPLGHPFALHDPTMHDLVNEFANCRAEWREHFHRDPNGTRAEQVNFKGICIQVRMVLDGIRCHKHEDPIIVDGLKRQLELCLERARARNHRSPGLRNKSSADTVVTVVPTPKEGSTSNAAESAPSSSLREERENTVPEPAEVAGQAVSAFAVMSDLFPER